MQKKIKIMFVLQQALGWRTYAEQLERVVRKRTDIDIHIMPLPHFRWRALPYKRQHMVQREKLYRHLDPIDGFAGQLGYEIRAEIDRAAPDLVHFSAQYPAASVFRRKNGPPFTAALDATRVNMDKQTGGEFWSRRDVMREGNLLKKAERLFPWSHWAGLSAIDDYGVCPKKIEVIVPSICATVLPPRSAATTDRQPRVAFIGNDFLRKGGDKLHAWVTGPLAGRCELHIVSSDPITKSLGGPGVVVHGRVPHSKLIGELLPSMDLLCHPTQADMSAYVVIEAAFAGVAALASSLGGITELIKENETGWVCDRNDEAGFIRTLEMLFASPQLLASAGRRARLHAEANFDATKNYDKMLDSLKSIVRAETKELS